MKKSELPTLLVIGNPEENWTELCKEYSSHFKVEQARWDEIFLCNYHDTKHSHISLAPSSEPNCERQKTIRNNIHPTLVLIRMMCHYIGGRLGETPDYRNILYGLYHANIPMINALEDVIAEIEKPIMYGRLRKIRDKYGQDKFPLIPQCYYPEFKSIGFPPSEPFVLKVGFPHAGYGKMRIKDRDELEDIKSIIAINNTYSAAEPLIKTAYELRIVFIAPDYYRAHQRIGPGWKVNFGMANEREDVEMNKRWKNWIDWIFEEFPTMVTFDIDAIVDENGNEYILELNGSSQGFAPEHGNDDLKHMREMVIMKMEEITGKKIRKDQSKENFFVQRNIMKNKMIPQIQSKEKNEMEIELINLRNKIETQQRDLNILENKVQRYSNIIKTKDNQIKNLKIHPGFENGKIIGICCLLCVLIHIFIYSYLPKIKK